VIAVRLLTTLGWVAIAPQLLFGLIRSSGKRVAPAQPTWTLLLTRTSAGTCARGV